jgi:hypothetical protein
MSDITDYLDGMADGPVFLKDLSGRFDDQVVEEWLLSGKTSPYFILRPFPPGRRGVLIFRLSHPSANEQWRALINDLRGMELYQAALRFREYH